MPDNLQERDARQALGLIIGPEALTSFERLVRLPARFPGTTLFDENVYHDLIASVAASAESQESGLFGIELASNFNVPYFARSGTEFWNRWHITLSQWLHGLYLVAFAVEACRAAPSSAALAAGSGDADHVLPGDVRLGAVPGGQSLAHARLLARDFDWSGELRWPSGLVLFALIPPLWIDWVQYRHNDNLVFLR